VQASDHISSVVEQLSNSNCNRNLMNSMSPNINRTKSPPMRQRSEKMKIRVWFSLPVWQTVVPRHHYWFQMSVDALSLHWLQELVVSGLRKTDMII